MRILFFLLFPIFLSAQINRAYGVIEIGSFPTSSSTGPKFAYRPADSSFYRWTSGNTWVKVLESSIDPDTLYLKQLSGTTALVDGDTINISTYLLKTDTTSFLAPYIKLAGWGLLKTTNTLAVDTSKLATRYYSSTLPTILTANYAAISNGTNLVARNLFDNNTYAGVISRPWKFGEYTTAGLPTGVTGYTVYNTTLNGIGWYDGTRWNYVPKSDRSALTSTYIPFVNSSGQLTESPNLYYSSGTFTNTTSLTGAVPLFSIFGDPGSGTGSVIQFLVRNTNTTSNKTEFKFGGTTTARQWSFGTDINGSGENSFFLYANNSNKTTIYSTDAGNTAIGYSGNPNTTHARYTLDVWGTDGINFPRGTTAQRPGVTPGTNPLRWSTSDTGFEWYDGTKWNNIVASSFIAGTNKNVPYFNSSSQLAQSTSLQYDVAGGLFTLSLNRSGGTFYTAINTQATASAYSGYNAQTSAGQGRIIKLSATYSSYKNQRASDFTLYNDPTGGNVSIMNDYASGTFNVAVGGSSTAQMTLASTGNLLLGTTTDVVTSILTARSTTKSSSPFPLHTLAESDAITGVQGNFDYETTQNGLRWHNGTRKAYALESTFARGTTTRIPFFDANGQVTDISNFSISSTGALSLPTVRLKITTPANSAIEIGSGATTGAISNFAVAIGANANASSPSASGGAIALGVNSTTGTSGSGIAIGQSATTNNSNSIAIGRSSSSLINQAVIGGTVSDGNASRVNEFILNTDGVSGNAPGVNVTIKTGNAVGTNQAGGNFTFIASKGTGSANAGSLIFSSGAPITSGSTVQPTTERFRVDGNTGFIGFSTASPTQELDINGDAYIRDSIRLATTPAHTAITGLLTRDATGWVGLGTIGSGLSYSGGVLSATATGDNIYTADGALTGNRTVTGGGYWLKFPNAEFNIGDTTWLFSKGVRPYLYARSKTYKPNQDSVAGQIILNVTGPQANLQLFGSANAGNNFSGAIFLYDVSANTAKNKGWFVANDQRDFTEDGLNFKQVGTGVSGFVSHYIMRNNGTFTVGNPTYSPVMSVSHDTFLVGKLPMINSNINGNSAYNEAPFKIINLGTVGAPSTSNSTIFNATIRSQRHGTGISEATDLSKTQSNYIAGFATDGTVIETEGLHIESAGQIVFDDYTSAAPYTPTAVGEEATELFITTSATTGKVLQRAMRQTSSVKDADLVVTDDMLELSFDIHVWAYCSSAASDSVVIDLPTPSSDYVGQTVSVYGDGRNATPNRDVYVRCVGARLWHGNATPQAETYYQVTSLALARNSKTAQFVCIENPDTNVYYWQLIQTP